MEGTDFPTPTLEPATDGSPLNRRQGSSLQRAAAAALLAVGLLTVGGVAIVNAASPDPSASTAPSATQTPGGTGGQNGTGGSGSGQQGDCPNM
jgi:hypothetical protein